MDLSFLFVKELGEAPEPYERVLSDALQGNASPFAREDAVEETWRIVQPLLETPGDPERYKPGTWGPAGVSKVVAGYPRWHEPWLPPEVPRLTSPAATGVPPAPVLPDPAGAGSTGSATA